VPLGIAWRDTHVPRTTSGAPGVQDGPQRGACPPQLHFRGALTLAQCSRAGKAPRKPPMSHEWLCPRGHPATAATERERARGQLQGCLHPGELGVCFPAAAPSWSIGPTAELGLRPALRPPAEGSRLLRSVGSRTGFYCSPGGGRGGAAFQPWEGGDGGALGQPPQLGAQRGVGAKSPTALWGNGGQDCGTISWHERVFKGGVKGR